MEKLIERYRYSVILLKQLVKTDFKLRYQGSMLGYAWSLLRPLFLFITLYIVFAKFLGVGADIPHFPVYLLLGIVLWNYFLEITTGSVSAIVGKGDLIRKINFPKYIIVIAGCISAFINLLLNAVIIGVFMIVTGVDIDIHALLAIPLILELTIFALGLAFFLSAAFVRFRDIGYIWEIGAQAAFYATPILYPLTMVIEKTSKDAAGLLLLNPMAQIIQDFRHVLVTPEAVIMSDLYGSSLIWLVPISIVIVTAGLSMWYFRIRSKYFAEDV